eukprot:4559455-Ditylum_brightwellii.AAC.1
MEEEETKENAKDEENMVFANMKDVDILMNTNTQSEFKDEGFLFSFDEFKKYEQEQEENTITTTKAE